MSRSKRPAPRRRPDGRADPGRAGRSDRGCPLRRASAALPTALAARTTTRAHTSTVRADATVGVAGDGVHARHPRAVVHEPHGLDVGVDAGARLDRLREHDLERVLLGVVRATELAEAALLAADAVVPERPAAPARAPRSRRAGRRCWRCASRRGSRRPRGRARSSRTRAQARATPAPTTPYLRAQRSRMASGVRLHRFVLCTVLPPTPRPCRTRMAMSSVARPPASWKRRGSISSSR